MNTNFKDVNEASFTLDAIREMAETMNEIYEQMKRTPKHLYGQYYLQERAKYDASRVTMKYERWKTQEWDETFESLKDLQTLVVAEFLTKRPLRFSRRPTLREIAEVQLDLVQNRLSNVFAYCEDFKEMCACFRRFNWWEGDILKLDYNRYGKYLLFNYHKMTEEERRAFFELDIMLELINKDMAKVMPAIEDDEAQMDTEGEMEMKIVQAARTMRAEGTLKHLYDYTWVMMLMNETKWLPSFDTPTSFVDYMGQCGVEIMSSRSNITKYYDKARGEFPNWTFDDADGDEAKRRNNVGKRFLNLVRSGNNSH